MCGQLCVYEGSGKPEHHSHWELQSRARSDEWEGQGESVSKRASMHRDLEPEENPGGVKVESKEKHLIHLYIRTSNSYLALTIQTQ